MENNKQEQSLNYIERGSKIIFESLQQEWKECVDNRLKDLYNGRDVDAALKIMEALNLGMEIEEAYSMLNSFDLSGHAESMVLGMIFHFVDRGPELLERAYAERMDDDLIKDIAAQKERNKKLKEANSSITM